MRMPKFISSELRVKYRAATEDYKTQQALIAQQLFERSLLDNDIVQIDNGADGHCLFTSMVELENRGGESLTKSKRLSRSRAMRAELYQFLNTLQKNSPEFRIKIFF